MLSTFHYYIVHRFWDSVSYEGIITETFSWEFVNLVNNFGCACWKLALYCSVCVINNTVCRGNFKLWTSKMIIAYNTWQNLRKI
jgi:hypothetical protein